MSDATPAVFLSYASQDADAARRICEALHAAGIEVWFDQSELRGGDAWDQKIRKQIKACALFVPIVSQAAQGRREAYFRLEWKLADERTHLMATGTPFLLPVTIDETNDRDALVPDSFLAVQWTKAPGGQVPAAFSGRVRKLLEGDVAEAVRGESLPAGRPSTRGGRRRWLRPVLAAGLLLLVGTGYAIWHAFGRPTARPAVPVAAALPAATPLSEGRQLAQKADALIGQDGITTEQLAVAAELCSRAVTLDPSAAQVWATASVVDTMHVSTGFDASESRRQQAFRKAARAMALAPKSTEARWANAYALAYAGGTPAMRAEALGIAAALVKERPDSHQLLVDYGTLLRDCQHYDEAASIFERAGDEQSAGWNYFLAGRMVEARRMVDRLLAHGPSANAALLKSFVEGIGFEDLDAAAAAVALFTPTDLLDVSPLRSAMTLAFYQHEPNRVIQLVGTYPQEFLLASGAAEPKRYFSGLAQEMAGRADAARAEWRVALQQVKERLSAQPNEPDLLIAQALLLACLDETGEAKKILALFLSLVPDPENDDRALLVLVRLGETEAVVTRLETKLRGKKSGWRFLHSEVRFDPRWDGLRGEPRVQAMLRETLWPEAKPFTDPKTEVKP